MKGARGGPKVPPVAPCRTLEFLVWGTLQRRCIGERRYTKDKKKREAYASSFTEKGQPGESLRPVYEDLLTRAESILVLEEALHHPSASLYEPHGILLAGSTRQAAGNDLMRAVSDPKQLFYL